MEIEVTSEITAPDGRTLPVANYSSVSTGEIARDPQVRTLMTQLSQWVQQARAVPGQGMFDRSLYVAPDTPYKQMQVARHAVLDDDIVAGVADATEALAFDGGLKWESGNPDDADVFNQLSADINLDAKIREMWRDCLTLDQFVCAKMWGQREFTIRGRTANGNRKKRRISAWVPTRLVLLDPAKIVPVGHGPLREDRLAWSSTISEMDIFGTVAENPIIDPLMSILFTGRYVPGVDEQAELAKLGVHVDNLLELNADWVFRHCTTKPDYAKFPDLRLKWIFGLLDLKRQLMASDRAMLVGAANYILLIRKGSDTKPATQEEVSNLKANYQFLAKLPVIISDHRLDIDVIAPKLDFVLKRDAYDVLDSRILARILATFVAPGRASSDAGVSSFADVLASAIQNRRHMIKRTLEREISRAVVEHPKNEGIFEQRPSLVFTPRTVSVGTSQAALQAMLTLRTQREISRDTILEYIGLDQATEAQRLDLEDQLYDDIFRTRIPFAATEEDTDTGTPNGTPEAPQNSGGRGGRPVGGGATPQSPQRQARPRTDEGNSTKERA